MGVRHPLLLLVVVVVVTMKCRGSPAEWEKDLPVLGG